MFYTYILFTFGLASAIALPNIETNNNFIKGFVNSNPVKTLIDKTKPEIKEYLKYLILIPSALNLASIKLITNYDGNKILHKSKSKSKQLDTAKLLIFAHVFLLAIIVLFGFFITDILENIPLYALGLLYVVSIAELIASIIVYISY
jgi:hypothetical protein